MDAEAAIASLLGRRAPGASICPSEAARLLDADGWRDRMEEVRAAGRALARSGRIVVTQGGVRVDPALATGPIRYRAVRP